MSRGAIALIVVVALLGGIAGVMTGQYLQRKPVEQARRAALEAAEPGSPMPAFVLPGLDGVPVDRSAFAGQALLVNFWATWCGPCRREMPALMALHEEIEGRGGAVLGIALDRPDDVRTYVEELEIAYPILVADGLEGNRLAQRFGNSNVLLPYSVFVDRNGEIVDVVFGELEMDHARELMAPLLR